VLGAPAAGVLLSATSTTGGAAEDRSAAEGSAGRVSEVVMMVEEELINGGTLRKVDRRTGTMGRRPRSKHRNTSIHGRK
jgi:hypothetical protein